MARVFLSYAMADADLAVEVFGWLGADGHEVFFARDRHAGIGAGEDWKLRLYQELREVDAVVCLVTPAYLASHWCTAEVAVADARGCRLIPVRTAPDLTHMLIERHQYTGVDPVEARGQVLAALRRLDAGGPAELREGENPYPGLASFDARRRRWFFGRVSEVREVAARIRAEAGPGVVAVTGPSGCGKSSLVAAGVVPLIDDDPGWLVVDSWSPKTDPLYQLAVAVTRTARRVGRDWSLAEVCERLAVESGLREMLDELRTGGQRVLVAIDQAEELFSSAVDAGHRAGLGGLLWEALSGPVRVVLTLRVEYLGDLSELPGLSAGIVDTYLLGPMSRDMLRLAIEEPARMSGLRVEPELLARLVADTDSGDALPLLGFALHRLAAGLSRGDVLTVAAYDALGAGRGESGLPAVLADRADEALRVAGERGGLTSEQVIAGLVRLVKVDGNGRWTRRLVERAGLSGAMRAALEVFVDHRLLTASADGEGGSVRFTHEALLTAWPPLARAIDEHGTALRAALTVEQAAIQWADAGLPDGYLWDAERFTATLHDLALPLDAPKLSPPSVELNTDAVGFLTATRTRIRTIRSRERQRRTRAIAVLSMLLVLALAAAGIAAVASARATRNAQEARRQHDSALARQLATQSEALSHADPALAQKLAAAAWRTSPNPETRYSMRNALTSRQVAVLAWHTDAVVAVAFSPDGTTLASASHDKEIQLWDVASRHPVGDPLKGHGGEVNAVAFSPNGKILASGGDDGLIVVWDTASRKPTATLAGHTGAVTAVTFSPDGTTLASASYDGTVRLWNVAGASHIGDPLIGHTGEVVHTVAFSPDGKTMVSAAGDRTIRFWDVAGRRQLGDPLTGSQAAVFSPDGTTLAASVGGSIQLWNVADRRPIGTPLTGSAHAVAFSPDGTTLASANRDGTVRLWDVAEHRQIGNPLTGHISDVMAVAFSPDGTTLASAGYDRTVRLWEVTRHRQIGPPFAGHTDAARAVAFSPDGTMLASAGDDKTVRLWDIAGHRLVDTLRSPDSDKVDTVAFSPDGETLASADDGGSIVLWDLATRHQVGRALTGDPGGVNNLAFSPDGTTLVSAGNVGEVMLWNLAIHRRIGGLTNDNHFAVFAVAFSPDGKTVATGGIGGLLSLWDVASRHQINESFAGSGESVTHVVFSPDSRTLAAASNDGSVRLWDVASQEQVGDPLTGHTGQVHALAISPDGTTLATGDDGGSIRVWDAQTHHPLGDPLTGHTESLASVVFSPDGKTLASASLDGTIRLWNTGSYPDPLTEICHRVHEIDPVEWDRYTSGEPRPTICP